MTLLELHHDHVQSTSSAPITPVLVGDWWCRTCGRPEADEDTRLCPECASYRTRAQLATARRVAELASMLVSAALLAGALALRHDTRRGGQQ
jgi:Zn finger protein HypA/HybF involved in hydrogenase expression